MYKEDRLVGIFTILKRTRETLEDDIAMGAILALCIGNAVQMKQRSASGGVR
jgi:hypothetical protein